MGLVLSILSPTPDVDIFQEEVTGEGVARGEVGPLQAPVSGVSEVHLPPHLDHPHLQLWATAAQAPLATQPVLMLALPSMVLDSSWSSHGWLSHSSVQGQLRASHRP